MKYIVLLRGINISGKNKISMSELKKVLEENNYKNVITYLNSGNIILESELSKEEMSKIINNIIKSHFNLDIPVFTTTDSELEDVLNNSPKWWAGANKKIYDNLICIIPPTTYLEVYEAVGEPNKNIDKIKEYNNYIFWSFDLNNYRKSTWWVKTASTDIKDKITIRTANTIKKLIDICNK